MLELTRVAPPPAAAVFAKLEFLNPGGSIKDRAALGMILDAEARGLLHPGLRFGGHGRQHRGRAGADRSESRLQSEAVCPEGFAEEKCILMRGFGAEVVRHARG